MTLDVPKGRQDEVSVGPKSENVENHGFDKLSLRRKAPRISQENEQASEPRRLGGGRGMVNPPRRSLVWRF